MTPNMVLGVPERIFCQIWCRKLWEAMSKLQRGFRHWTLQRVPPAGASHWRGPRRGDKPTTSKVARFLLLFGTPALKSFEGIHA